MKSLCQLWVFDRGTPDIEIMFVLSRNPLKFAPSHPTRIVEWADDQTDYWVGYWHMPGMSMEDDHIKSFVTAWSRAAHRSALDLLSTSHENS